MAVEAVTHEFDDDDAGYLEWLAAHPDGYVINIARRYSAAAARVHRADCRTINGQNPRGGMWTGRYVKVCAGKLAELDDWATNQVGEPLVRCGTCQPTGAAAQTISTEQTKKAITAAVREGRFVINGPTSDSAVVRAWADDYVHFERRPPWQEHLRNEIRSRCGHLTPLAGQVLHATFCGKKLSNADVENLTIYNIGSFRDAGRYGICFELSEKVPPAPDGVEYRCGYRYALAPRSESFIHWRQGRTLAAFDWADLGAFAGEKKLAQVWLAIARGQVELSQPIAVETRFGVRVHVRPPHGYQPVWGGLVKAVFDGVICAFQAHTDTAVLRESVPLLAKTLAAQLEDIERLLCDRRRAVLGEVPRLVSPYRSGVKWNPSDHLCVAGELLGAEPGPGDDRWAIKGEVFEIHPASRLAPLDDDIPSVK